MAPHDSVAKNKGEYNSCVACYFRDELGGAVGIDDDNDDDDDNNDDEETGVHGDDGTVASRTMSRRCSPTKQRQDEESKRDVDNRGKGFGGEGEAGDNKGLSRFCV